MISQNYRLPKPSSTNFQKTVLHKNGQSYPIPPEKETAFINIIEQATDSLQLGYSLHDPSTQGASHTFKTDNSVLILEDNNSRISYFSHDRSMIVEKDINNAISLGKVVAKLRAKLPK